MNSSNISTFAVPSKTQLWNDPEDLALCDNLPVHTPGAIMPHGVMLILSINDYCILSVSDNTEAWFNCTAKSLLGKRLDCIVDLMTQQKLEAGFDQLKVPLPPHYLGSFKTLESDHAYDVFGHRSGDVLVLEFESLPSGVTLTSTTQRFAEVAESIAVLQANESWQGTMGIAVKELKRMTGFDSVIGVRLLADGTGQAVAEARESEFASFLDKRFPYSDMPQPARQQMLLMPIQYVPKLEYRPVPLVMEADQGNPAQLDLRYSLLRSISPQCSQYYINMGAQSRLLLVLMDQGQLWGFFSCLSASPRTVCYSDRLAFQSFAQIVTPLLIEKDKAEQDREALMALRNIDALVNDLTSAPVFEEAVKNLPARLLQISDFSGALLSLDDNRVYAGVIPNEEQINKLMTWLDEQDSFFITDQLPLLFPPAGEYADKATGLCAIRLMDHGQYLLGFRPEWVHEVNWAGDPRKPVVVDIHNAEHRLTPRGSFEAWKQVVRGRSRPWHDYQTQALKGFQQSLRFLQLSDQRDSMMECLQRSNSDLETFAYVVSHDLQEPLRGLLKTTYLLKESASDRLTGQDHSLLDSLFNLSKRMSGLIEGILTYSRASQTDLEKETVDLNGLIKTVLETLSALIDESAAQINIPRQLPSVTCDPIRTAAVFQNLIANAVKYNDKANKQIEIGYLDGAPMIFYIRDNGIGILPQHQDKMFALFRRLHARDAFGGGTGAGLTITRKHIEKQGGKLWLESEPGLGTTFYFTMATG